MNCIREVNTFILNTSRKGNYARERSASRLIVCTLFGFALFFTSPEIWGEDGRGRFHAKEQIANSQGRDHQKLPLNSGFGSPQFRQASNLPDLSGLVWLGGDCFLAVHDAKVKGESGNPRVSLLYLPTDSQGVLWKPQVLNFRGMKSNDLESAARIPGTKDVLLVESGDNGNARFQRIFKARVEEDWVRIIDVTPWPVTIYNVEASAVAALRDRFVFLFAERAQNLPSTQLRWAVFDPEDLSFGPFQSMTFSNPDPKAFNRPVVAMDLDSSGQIYVSSAFDAEAAGLPDPDNGPFTSAVFCIGELTELNGQPQVTLFDTPSLLGTLNGFKVESIAVRESDEYGLQILVGTDDENYGATLRLLPPPTEY